MVGSNVLDTLLVPKVGKPSDLEFVALLLEQIEAAKGYQQINLHALIETAALIVLVLFA